jgi:hypothetical protein
MDLFDALRGLGRAIVITRHAQTLMPVMVATGQVFSDATAVFTTDNLAMLAFLDSAAHYWWAISHGSSLKGDPRYTSSAVFETLPLPELTPEMLDLGDRLDTIRRNLMLSRQAGLTATYNLVHDPKFRESDIAELRDIHQAIDVAVVEAYGWYNLVDALGHGFYETRQGIRYTIAPGPRQEIMDRLLKLNHARYAEEQRTGLHAKKPSRKRPAKGTEGQQTLLDM